MKLALRFALRLSELNDLQTNLASMVQLNIKITENLAYKSYRDHLMFHFLVFWRRNPMIA